MSSGNPSVWVGTRLCLRTDYLCGATQCTLSWPTPMLHGCPVGGRAMGGPNADVMDADEDDCGGVPDDEDKGDRLVRDQQGACWILCFAGGGRRLCWSRSWEMGICIVCLHACTVFMEANTHRNLPQHRSDGTPLRWGDTRPPFCLHSFAGSLCSTCVDPRL